MVVADYNDEKFSNLTKNQKRGTITAILSKVVSEKDSSDLVELLSSNTFKQLETTLERYKELRKILKKVLIQENDQVAYINGIKTLLDTRKYIKSKNNYYDLKYKFQVCALKNEGSVEGYKMWMKDAFDHGVFDEQEYQNSISKEQIAILINHVKEIQAFERAMKRATEMANMPSAPSNKSLYFEYYKKMRKLNERNKAKQNVEHCNEVKQLAEKKKSNLLIEEKAM